MTLFLNNVYDNINTTITTNRRYTNKLINLSRTAWVKPASKGKPFWIL